jgi:hypothetical protein
MLNELVLSHKLAKAMESGAIGLLAEQLREVDGGVPGREQALDCGGS